MTHEEEFCEAIFDLIDAYYWYYKGNTAIVDRKQLEQAKANLLRVVKNEAEKDG